MFGATVTMLDENDKPVKYQIVGQTEADASTARISYNSPLGRALIGRKVDDEVEVSVPAATAITSSGRSSSSEPFRGPLAPGLICRAVAVDRCARRGVFSSLLVLQLVTVIAATVSSFGFMPLAVPGRANGMPTPLSCVAVAAGVAILC